MRTAFVHVTATKNVGDLMSGPHHYFPFDGDVEVHDVHALPAGHWDAVVFGGGAVGAMLSKPPVRRWLAGVRRRVAWGVGRTVPGATGPQPVPVNEFNLYGTREWPPSEGQRFVPCVSCVHPLFNRRSHPCREAVLFYNARKKTPAVDLPALGNDKPLHDVVEHLLSGRVVVTNSYHGAYWAMLLNRPAIVVGAYSSKFTCYPWPIPVRTDTRWRDSLPDAAPEPTALAMCRTLNEGFYQRVKEVLHA